MSNSDSFFACPPIGLAVASPLQRLETPAVVIERSKLDANIALAAKTAGVGGLSLRPHIKTHKSVAIARLQLAAGAVGITSAKSEEAEVFLSNGVRSLTLAHPLIAPVKIARLLRAAAEHESEVRFILDSPVGIDAIAAAAAEFGHVAPVFLKVDVGLGRCGVDPASPCAESLVHTIVRTKSLHFRGLLSHAGHAYAAGKSEGVRRVAKQERETMTGLADCLRRNGIDVPEVSVGSTPTLLAHDGFEGITEIRPGNYVFLDLTQVALGLATLAEVALSVVATVVSCNSSHGIVDAGSKVLSSDRGPHGSDSLKGFGLAFPLEGTTGEGMPVTRLSEEHGFIQHGGRSLKIGSRMRIFPNHSCVVANLSRFMWAINEDGSVENWPVDARASFR